MKSANLFLNRPSALFAFATMLPLSAIAGPTVSKGVLLMGFRCTDTSAGPGVGQYVVVNIGQAATYRNGTAPTITNINSQLETVFGTGWSSRTDMQWGVAGCPTTVTGETFNSDATNTFYVSRAENVAGTPDAAALTINTPPARNTIASNITNLIGLSIVGGFDDSTAASNPLIALQGSNTPANDWRSYMGGTTVSGINYGPAGSNLSGSNNDLKWDLTGIETTPNKTLSLYRFAGAANGQVTGTYLGHLKIESNGDVSFNAASTGTSYSAWALSNTGSASTAANADSDHDGVSNGIEWFTGSSTNPTISAGTITWPRATGNTTATSVKVQTSTNLLNWTDAMTGLQSGTGPIVYTVPTGQPKIFVRLAVSP